MKDLVKTIIRLFWTKVSIRKCRMVGSNVYINGKSFLTNKTIIGSNVHINGLHVYGNGEVTIGDNCHFGNGVKILTSNHNYNTDICVPYDNKYVNKNVEIKDNVWIGINVIILGGVSIGEGAIIQAGSVVSCDVDSLSIVGGNPACKFKERNVKLYEKAKKNMKEGISYKTIK